MRHLRSGLAAVAGLAVAGEAGPADELLAQLAVAPPDVVLLDLRLPGPDILALLPALREQYPQRHLPARGELTNEHYVARAFDLGAHGYVLTSSTFAELVHGLRTVAAGRPFLCSVIGLALLGRPHQAGRPARPHRLAPTAGCR